MATRPGVETPQLRNRRVAAIRYLTGSLFVGAAVAAHESARPSDKDLERALDERGVPTHADLQQVLAQLETLAAKLDGMTSEAESAQDA